MKWYPRVLVGGVALGFLASLMSGDGASTIGGRLGADYPAFYAAGRIIVEGDGRDLYRWERQLLAQQGLFPPQENLFMPFPYPAFVAVAYSPLALLSYRVSYFIHTMFMSGALLLALWAMRPMSTAIAEQSFLVFALLIFYYPLLKSIIGGQNTVITLLLVALLWRAVTDGKDFRAGVCLGLLLFKPQYGLPIIGLFLLSGRWKVVAASALTGLVQWVIGVWISGWGWVSVWVGYANWVARTAANIDKHNGISWIGFLEGILGTESRFGAALAYILAGITVAVTCWVWWRRARRQEFSAQMGIAMGSVLLIPPHAFYYDAGLLAFTWISLISKDWKYKTEIIAGVWILGFSQVLAEWLGFSPIFFVVVFTFIMALRLNRK
jgi:Glycosyltransferase family 87